MAYILLQNGYKVDWAAYLTAVQDLENSWNALIYARRHSKVDLWKSIDPDWRDEGYQFVYLISREESYAVRSRGGRRAAGGALCVVDEQSITTCLCLCVSVC